MKLEGLVLPSQGLSNNSYPELNQPIPYIGIYFFKIYSNIVLSSIPRPC